MIKQEKNMDVNKIPSGATLDVLIDETYLKAYQNVHEFVLKRGFKPNNDQKYDAKKHSTLLTVNLMILHAIRAAIQVDMEPSEFFQILSSAWGVEETKKKERIKVLH